ncbi:MAG: DNA primase [Candidatus Doudnabacteria bacterium]|jgi:DNA primase
MTDPTLQEIKDRLDLVDVISGYIPVKKAGMNFKAPCPFHNEKTPSLIISPQKQIWHCFGCGEGGDVFGFVIKYENLEFKDALKLLAGKAGVTLPQYKAQDKGVVDEKELLLRINNFAARYYHEVLTTSSSGKIALEYLKNRGVTDGTIKQWQIGYAPEEFHFLEQALVKKQVAINDLVKAGVSAKNERGQVYDRFRGRVTFPICNYFGDVVGFTARILKNDDKSAKYINSPETPIYNKSKTLFGLNFAKEAIRKKDEMVIVEGQMDCISLHQAGFNNVIASSGTAYNESAVDFTSARRLSKNVKLCFDSDQAGQIALKKTGEMLLRQGFRVKVVTLVSAKDPDELVRKSPGLWDKAVSEAVWFLDYYIDLAGVKFPAGSVEQKLFLNEQVVPFLGFITDALEQDHYIHKIVTGFGVFERTLRGEIKKQNVSLPAKKSFPTEQKQSGSLLLQKEVLGALLFSKDFYEQYAKEIEAVDFENAEIRDLALAWIKSGGQDNGVKEQTVAKEALFMVESQLDELSGDESKVQKNLGETFKLFKLSAIKRRQLSLEAEIKAAEAAGNKPRVEELGQIFANLLKSRKQFE